MCTFLAGYNHTSNTVAEDLPEPLMKFCEQVFVQAGLQEGNDAYDAFCADVEDLVMTFGRLSCYDRCFQRSFASRWSLLSLDEGLAMQPCGAMAAIIRVLDELSFGDPLVLTAGIRNANTTGCSYKFVGAAVDRRLRSQLNATALALAYDVLARAKGDLMANSDDAKKRDATDSPAAVSHVAEKAMSLLRMQEKQCASPSVAEIKVALDKATELCETEAAFLTWVVKPDAGFMERAERQYWTHLQSLTGVVAWDISQTYHGGLHQLSLTDASRAMVSRCPCVSCGVARGLGTHDFANYARYVEQQVKTQRTEVLDSVKWYVRGTTLLDILHSMATLHCRSVCNRELEACSCWPAWQMAEQNILQALSNAEATALPSFDPFVLIWQQMAVAQTLCKLQGSYAHANNDGKMQRFAADMANWSALNQCEP
jgi:hypothetical protein